MLKYQSFIFLPIIFLPIFLALLFHKSLFIAKVSKVLLLISLVLLIIAFPIIMLIELKFWILLLIIIPLIFRILEIVIKKLDIAKYFANISADALFRILLASTGALVMIVISSDYDIWSGLWIALVIFIFVGTKINDTLKQLDKNGLIYGAVFGVLSFVFAPALRNEIGLITYLFAWTLYLIPYIFIPFLRKNKYTEAVIFILIPITTVILLKNGGIPFVWKEIFSSLFIILLLNSILFAIYFLLDRKKLPKVIQHYTLPIISNILIIVLILTGSMYSELVSLIKVPTDIFILESIILNAGRVLSSITLSGKNHRAIFYSNYITDIFQFLFGKIIGQWTFNLLIGKQHNQLKKVDILLGTVFSFSLLMFSYFLINSKDLGKLINEGFQLNSFSKMIIIYFMTNSSLIILNDLSELVNPQSRLKGLDNDSANKICSSITVNYFFLVAYYILLNLPFIEQINIYIKTFVLIWMLFASYSLYKGLYNDLSKPNYNNLKISRHFISVLLYGFSTFIMIYIASTNAFQKFSYELLANLFNKSYYIVAVSIVLSKLVGFDTGISSELLRKKHLKYAIIDFVTITFSFIPMIFFQFIFYTLFSDIALATQITNFLIYMIMLDFCKSFTIWVLPSTNELNESVKDFLTFKSLRIESKKSEDAKNIKSKRVRK